MPWDHVNILFLLQPACTNLGILVGSLLCDCHGAFSLSFISSTFGNWNCSNKEDMPISFTYVVYYIYVGWKDWFYCLDFDPYCYLLRCLDRSSLCHWEILPPVSHCCAHHWWWDFYISVESSSEAQYNEYLLQSTQHVIYINVKMILKVIKANYHPLHANYRCQVRVLRESRCDSLKCREAGAPPPSVFIQRGAVAPSNPVTAVWVWQLRHFALLKYLLFLIDMGVQWE